jgi:hypothetical protein
MNTIHYLRTSSYTHSVGYTAVDPKVSQHLSKAVLTLLFCFFLILSVVPSSQAILSQDSIA